jgi:D-arabinitol 2-dehydrogenase
VARTLPGFISQRSVHSTSSLRRDDKEKKEEHEGSFARTDESIQVEYPQEGELPSSTPVQGRGGLHFKRTLASFSLEGRVGVVTGGARGLGLVMSQAMVISGADIAIVDLNSMFYLPVQGFD